jgi:hypothetical protein
VRTLIGISALKLKPLGMLYCRFPRRGRTPGRPWGHRVLCGYPHRVPQGQSVVCQPRASPAPQAGRPWPWTRSASRCMAHAMSSGRPSTKTAMASIWASQGVGTRTQRSSVSASSSASRRDQDPSVVTPSGRRIRHAVSMDYRQAIRSRLRRFTTGQQAKVACWLPWTTGLV